MFRDIKITKNGQIMRAEYCDTEQYIIMKNLKLVEQSSLSEEEFEELAEEIFSYYYEHEEFKESIIGGFLILIAICTLFITKLLPLNISLNVFYSLRSANEKELSGFVEASLTFLIIELAVYGIFSYLVNIKNDPKQARLRIKLCGALCFLFAQIRLLLTL